jgi:hypothetical protein
MLQNFVHGVESMLPTILWSLNVVSNIIIVVFFALKFRPIKITVSKGSFRVFAKDANPQNLTNLVSALYYDGGQISAQDRKTILDRTNSMRWGFVKNEVTTPTDQKPVEVAAK